MAVDDNKRPSAVESGIRERVAMMNPNAVSEAKIYTGRIHYFDTELQQHVEVRNPLVVEVGRWTANGAEHRPEDYLCTYHAAALLGFKDNMFWLPFGEGNTGERKYFISPGFDDEGVLISYTPSEAQHIISEINQLLARAKQGQEQLHPKR